MTTRRELNDIEQAAEKAEMGEQDYMVKRPDGTYTHLTRRTKATKRPIDRPCSACSDGDVGMRYHDHAPPFRAEAPIGGDNHPDTAQMFDDDAHANTQTGGDNAAPPGSVPQYAVAAQPDRCPKCTSPDRGERWVRMRCGNTPEGWHVNTANSYTIECSDPWHSAAPPLTAEEAATEIWEYNAGHVDAMLISEIAEVIQRAIDAATGRLRERLKYLSFALTGNDYALVDAIPAKVDELLAKRERLIGRLSAQLIAEAEKVRKK